MQYVDELMGLETNFDIIHRVIRLGDTDACMYLIDGFCKDELMQKILQYLMDLKAEDFPKDAHEMSKIAIPDVEVDLGRYLGENTGSFAVRRLCPVIGRL